MPRTLAQNAQYIAETIKPAIKSAIEAQGVTVPSTDSFLDYADRIGEIEGGGSGYQLKDLPTGSISTVNDAAELPLNALKVSVEAWQEGSGDPSPNNIRPIHGWDSGEINVVGKNLLPPTTSETQGGITFTVNSDGSVTLSGTANSTSGKDIASIDLKGGVTYAISGCPSDGGSGKYGLGLYVDGDFVANDYGNGATYTPSADVQAVVAIRYWYGYSFDNLIFYPQLELGTTATTYKPYQGKQYTQQFPQKIYGAEWDVVNGGMKNCEVELSNPEDLPFTFYPAYSTAPDRFACQKSDMKANGLMLCDRYEFKTNYDSSDDGVISSNDGWITIIDSRFGNDVTAFKNSLVGMQLFYELATPTTIDLSPLSIRMNEGTNNLYADCADVIEGDYFVDEGAHRYQLYDYIESDGTQVIDLGFAPENGATVTTSFVLLSTQTSEAFVYGATDSSAWLGFAQNPASRNTIYENNTTGRSEAYIQNQQYLLTLTASRDYTNHLCMFGFYLNGYAPGIKTRLCYCKYNDNFYLPAKRKSDGVFGLYDVTNQSFLTDSAGGNAFVGGNPTGVEV